MYKCLSLVIVFPIVGAKKKLSLKEKNYNIEKIKCGFYFLFNILLRISGVYMKILMN